MKLRIFAFALLIIICFVTSAFAQMTVGQANSLLVERDKSAPGHTLKVGVAIKKLTKDELTIGQSAVVSAGWVDITGPLMLALNENGRKAEKTGLLAKTSHPTFTHNAVLATRVIKVFNVRQLDSANYYVEFEHTQVPTAAGTAYKKAFETLPIYRNNSALRPMYDAIGRKNLGHATITIANGTTYFRDVIFL